MTLGNGPDGMALLDKNAPVRLLLIEDADPDIQLVLDMLGEHFPYAEVEVARTLQAGLSQLASQWFDLVIAGLTLPDAQDRAVVRALRNTHPETALIVLADRADIDDLALWTLAKGAQDYLVRGQHDGPRLATALWHALQRKQAEEVAHRYLQLARGLLDALEAPTCAIDSASAIVAVNDAWREFAVRNGGVDGQSVGVNYLAACDRAAAEGGVGSEEAAIVAQGIRSVLSGSLARFQYDYPVQSDTESRWYNVRVAPAIIKDGPGAVVTHIDVTEIHQIQRSIAHQSLHDPLTDLPNRVLMLDRLEQAVNDAERRGLGVAVTHLDLHDYQTINNRFGYRAGDEVLVQVAARLQSQLRPGDTLARFSGDEFLVLWRDLDPARPGEAVELSEGLVGALGSPFETSGEPVAVAASAGVAVYSPGGGVDELMQSGDAALHEAKSRGPGHVVLFSPELRQAAQFSKSLEAELRLALESGGTQFVLHYQPVVDLTSGHVVAVEALVRWQHPVRGLLSPDRFIPLAETTGLIHQLGDWVLHQAIHDAVTLTHRGRELDIAVNFSVRQLDPRAAGKVQDALEGSGLRPGRLILEVTESAIVEDEQATAATLRALSELGVKIAIDDFGTGYSSLLYLRRYPINTLKIDREFVAAIGQSADDEAICGSIASLAAAVGATTVGEGVETVEQYAVLRSLGCHHGQGYLWSPAVPVAELDAAFAACDAVPVASPRSRTPREPEGLPVEAVELIATMHAEGASLHTIAGALNRTVGRHPRGVRWTARTVAQARETEDGLRVGAVCSGEPERDGSRS